MISIWSFNVGSETHFLNQHFGTFFMYFSALLETSVPTHTPTFNPAVCSAVLFPSAGFYITNLKACDQSLSKCVKPTGLFPVYFLVFWLHMHTHRGSPASIGSSLLKATMSSCVCTNSCHTEQSALFSCDGLLFTGCTQVMWSSCEDNEPNSMPDVIKR